MGLIILLPVPLFSHIKIPGRNSHIKREFLPLLNNSARFFLRLGRDLLDVELRCSPASSIGKRDLISGGNGSEIIIKISRPHRFWSLFPIRIAVLWRISFWIEFGVEEGVLLRNLIVLGKRSWQPPPTRYSYCGRDSYYQGVL